MPAREPRCLQTHEPAQTEALGAELAGALEPGDAVIVVGEMGSGKTTLVRGACRALGVSVPVSSPTFTIAQRYPAAVPVSHVDLFRVASLADEDPELLADYVGEGMISFIEMPPVEVAQLSALEREIEGLAKVTARIHLVHSGGDVRSVSLER